MSQSKEFYEAYLINQADVLERYVALAVDQGCLLDSDALHAGFASLEASCALDEIALGAEALAVVAGGASNPLQRVDKRGPKKVKEGFSLCGGCNRGNHASHLQQHLWRDSLYHP